MDNVKRADMFEHLRKANDSVTITQKMAVLNASPNALLKNHKRNDSIRGHRLPAMALSPDQSQGLNLLGVDPMKPPTLKQLRMESI